MIVVGKKKLLGVVPLDGPAVIFVHEIKSMFLMFVLEL